MWFCIVWRHYRLISGGEKWRGEGQDLGNLGSAYFSLGQMEKAIEHLEQSLALSLARGDHRGASVDLGNLGVAYRNLKQTDQAIEQYQRALEIARVIGDRHNEGNQLGNACAGLGEVEKAIEHHQQAPASARDIGDRRGEANTLANLGIICEEQGDTERARECWTQALALQEAVQDPKAERVRGWLAGLG